MSRTRKEGAPSEGCSRSGDPESGGNRFGARVFRRSGVRTFLGRVVAVRASAIAVCVCATLTPVLFGVRRARELPLWVVTGGKSRTGTRSRAPRRRTGRRPGFPGRAVRTAAAEDGAEGPGRAFPSSAAARGAARSTRPSRTPPPAGRSRGRRHRRRCPDLPVRSTPVVRLMRTGDLTHPMRPVRRMPGERPPMTPIPASGPGPVRPARGQVTPGQGTAQVRARNASAGPRTSTVAARRRIPRADRGSRTRSWWPG